MKRLWKILPLAILISVWGGTVALGDDVEPTFPETSTATPRTTSEFGSETQIEIALDDDGSVIPAITIHQD
jgi:hypothetical protein